MSSWLFDLGNTRLKYAALADDGGIGPLRAVAHDDAGHWLDGLPQGEVAYLASVVAQPLRVRLLLALATRFRRIEHAATLPRCGRLRIAYAQPRRLGVDRFLALLALAARSTAQPALVVGVGTALTIDLLDADGLHRGGRIAPSPALMRAALHAQVPALPPAGGDYREFGGDTGDALVSGCDGAALGLIERSLGQAAQLLGTPPQLHVHGGGAAALAPRLPAHRAEPALVLEGLAHWARASA